MIASKRFYRSRQAKIVAGVCTGLGQYFDVDPVLFRIGFVIFGLTTGPLAIATYILLAIAIPQRPEDEPEPAITSSMMVGNGRQVAGAILLGLGALALASNMGVFALVRWDIFWPLVMVAAGAALIVNRIR